MCVLSSDSAKLELYIVKINKTEKLIKVIICEITQSLEQQNFQGMPCVSVGDVCPWLDCFHLIC